MEIKTNKIAGGIYLVIDPSQKQPELFRKLQEALTAGVAVVQIWDNWGTTINKAQTIIAICELCHGYEVPVLINNDWQLLQTLPLDGIHFDVIPANYDQIKQTLNQDFLAGITCNNDLAAIEWADKNKLSYVSFCSLFPSFTSTSCELVSFETIKRARSITSLPIFLAGGIRLNNMPELAELNYDGVAIISGIMNAASPAQATKQYLTILNKRKHENQNYR